jgi:hypothetical protein
VTDPAFSAGIDLRSKPRLAAFCQYFKELCPNMRATRSSSITSDGSKNGQKISNKPFWAAFGFVKVASFPKGRPKIRRVAR